MKERACSPKLIMTVGLLVVCSAAFSLCTKAGQSLNTFDPAGYMGTPTTAATTVPTFSSSLIAEQESDDLENSSDEGTTVTLSLPLATSSHCPKVAGTAYYVAPAGNDNYPGTLVLPFRTIQKGIDMAQAGDTVYVRAGTYHEMIRIAGSGTECAPLVITGYPDERPVIDGRYLLPSWPDAGCDPVTGNCFNYGALVSLEGSHIIFSGFEVKHSRGRGIRIWSTYHCIVHDNYVHDVRDVGILVLRSEHNAVQANSVYRTGDYAPWVEGRDSRVIWPAGIALKQANHCSISANTVYNNWGEGIITMLSREVVVEDNRVYDNFAVQIYIETTGPALVQRNLVYHTNDAAIQRWGEPSSGIVLATEQPSNIVWSRDHTIINNICVGNGQNIAWWGPGHAGALINTTIAHNTLVNARENVAGSATNLFIQPTATHDKVRIQNNIIMQQAAGLMVSVPDDPAFAFSNNLWSSTPPVAASGPDDIVASPQLVNPEAPLVPGHVDPTWYRLGASSPALDGAVALTLVTDDFFGATRGSRPDIGAHERAGHNLLPVAELAPASGMNVPDELPLIHTFRGASSSVVQDLTQRGTEVGFSVMNPAATSWMPNMLGVHSITAKSPTDGASEDGALVTRSSD